MPDPALNAIGPEPLSSVEIGEDGPGNPCPAISNTAPAGRYGSALRSLRDKFSLTPEQAETLARVKFPCC
ncbi:hypothetical protein PAA8504_00480 [Palleronia abyssalis]|uniref:Uncharacterized protein n=1 Tax=Palleronia abyssalis TaxID=1501240 RepID=A0A2R8BR82_9RHOB|nr:hypothetical protein PAA8504_00480 [Palleronia abyssalis]